MGMTRMQAIQEQLDRYPPLVAPLRDAAKRYLKYPSELATDGMINIGHRPWVAELNYMFMMCPGIEETKLDRYAGRFQIEIPDVYRAFLKAVNGGFYFGMSLCGVPSSMLGAIPLLDRSTLQCHDLATAVTLWADEYRGVSGLFHFGGRHFSHRENVGYFLDHERIISKKKNGKIVGEWTDFTEFLTEELKASEELEEKLHPSQWER
jgi:hypothetical protein